MLSLDLADEIRGWRMQVRWIQHTTKTYIAETPLNQNNHALFTTISASIITYPKPRRHIHPPLPAAFARTYTHHKA